MPLLKTPIFSPLYIVKILINVPLSEAEANKEPSLLIDKQANLDSCAFIIFYSLLVFLFIQFLIFTYP